MAPNNEDVIETDNGCIPRIFCDSRLTTTRAVACSHPARVDGAAGTILFFPEPGAVLHQGACHNRNRSQFWESGTMGQ